ncbi:MAG: alpha/beta hydrolase [Smithella sp.]
MIKKIDIDNLKIACWINPRGFGDHQQSLIFIHGSGGDHTSWVYQYARLNNQFNIVAVDLPGHGSSTGNGAKNLDQYCVWIKKLLDVLQLKNPVLIGHSLGAAITLKVALQYPEIVNAIVPVGGGIKMPVNTDLLTGLKTNPSRIIDLFCNFSLAPENRPKLLEALKKSLYKINVDVMYDDLCACNDLDLTDNIDKINLQGLILCGMKDKMTPAQFSCEIAARIKGARLSLIGGAGHMVMLEKPEEFNKVLCEFASSISKAAYSV